MLSFLVLVSTSGQPLPASAVARCTRPPAEELPFTPVAATTWRADEGHVLVAAWADRPDGWHVGRHGCTLTTTTPWPLAGRLAAPSGVAFELTDRLGDDDPGALGWLTGAATVLRARPDGTGIVGAPPTGGGALHVAEGDGVLAISDRAALAAGGVGGATRRTDLVGLLRGTLLSGRSSIAGVDRLPPGSHVLLRGRLGAKRVDTAPPWADGADAPLEELAEAAADDVARLVELAGGAPGRRVLELGDDPGSLVLAAALAATGAAPRFSLRPRDAARAVPAATALARALDVPLDRPVRHEAGGEALDTRIRRAVGRTAATVAIGTARSGSLTAVRDGLEVLVTTTPGGPLAPDPGPTGRRLLRSTAMATLDSAQAAWASDRGRTGDVAELTTLLGELDRRWPLRQRAVADLAAPATVLDPLATPTLARLAVAATRTGADATAILVTALHPPTLAHRTPGGGDPVLPGDEAWRELAPVLEAHVLGHARDDLDDLVDLDEVAAVVRSGGAPDEDTLRTLEGALSLAVWAARSDVHTPSPAVVEPRTVVAVPEQLPTLVTGVTSTSLLDLTGVAVPLDDVEEDAMLGVRVDREVRDLVMRILLAVDAAPGHLPADLEERLSGPATAHLADPARTVLARRGGTLVDPRLALTLPFWRTHVGAPRVVLVAERPPDLATRSSAALPRVDLLGWWVDAMTAAAATHADVRIVDPNDLAESPEAEAVGWEGLVDEDGDVHDLLRVVRTVDSLVREVELEAARPLLRTIRLARAEDREVDPGRRRASPAAAPLHVVDQLWERAVEADARLAAQRATAEELEARLRGLEGELEELRGRRGLKAAWHVLTGRPS